MRGVAPLQRVSQKTSFKWIHGVRSKTSHSWYLEQGKSEPTEDDQRYLELSFPCLRIFLQFLVVLEIFLVGTDFDWKKIGSSSNRKKCRKFFFAPPPSFFLEQNFWNFFAKEVKRPKFLHLYIFGGKVILKKPDVRFFFSKNCL